MQNVRKKPIMVNLVAALVMCLVTFIIGFSISSFVLLDSRIESAQEKNSELSMKIDEKNEEIKGLNDMIEQKSKENVLLGEKIQEQAVTIEHLQSNIDSLQDNVAHISEVALNGAGGPAGSVITTVASLSVSQQLILLIALLVLLVLIISLTCVFISSRSIPKKEKEPVSLDASKPVKKRKSEPSSEEEVSEEPVYNEEATQEEPEETVEELPRVVTDAIDLLYRNSLENSISDLGGFKFGVTNFDEILSDKAKGKSFGNTENGDFVAFIAPSGQEKKLYIIPRYLTLSDSTVALRGVTDLFNITDGTNSITSGAIRIKSIAQPAVFSCGEHGWSIELKGTLSII